MMSTKDNQGLILENYSPALVSSNLLSSHNELEYDTHRLGLHGVPENGWNAKVLEFHGLDAASIAKSFK